MARECIRNCPYILEQLREISSYNFWSGPMAFHPDTFSSDENSGAGKLLRPCELTYDCQGPVDVERAVAKGFIRHHTEMQDVIVCGRPVPEQ